MSNTTTKEYECPRFNQSAIDDMIEKAGIDIGLKGILESSGIKSPGLKIQVEMNEKNIPMKIYCEWYCEDMSDNSCEMCESNCLYDI